MSKSKLNTVAPRQIIEKYGADTVRLFVLSDSPPEADLFWSDKGVDGASRFVIKVWRLMVDIRQRVEGVSPYSGSSEGLSTAAKELRHVVHSSLQRITKDLDGHFHFNTALARIREMTEALRKAASAPTDEVPATVLAEAARILIQVLAPYIPHVTEELWGGIGGEGVLTEGHWPIFDPSIAAAESITLVVQINGKLRARLEVSPDMSKADAEKAALAHEQIAPQLEGKTIRRVIVVPRRLVNIVVT